MLIEIRRTIGQIAQKLLRTHPGVNPHQAESWARNMVTATLYKRTIASFDRNYPFQSVSFETKTDGRASLTIVGRTPLTDQHLKALLIPPGPMLPDAHCHHDSAKQHNRIGQPSRIITIFFGLPGKGQYIEPANSKVPLYLDTPETIERLFNRVLGKLASLKPRDGDDQTFREAASRLTAAQEEFIKDFNHNFPGGNIYRRVKPFSSIDGSTEPLPVQDDRSDVARVLAESIRAGKGYTVLQLLREDPNRIKLCPFGLPLLNQVCFEKAESQDHAIGILDVLDILLMYGADPGAELFSRNTIEWAIEYAILRVNSGPTNQASFFMEKIRRMMWFLKSPDPLDVAGDSLRTPLGELVQEGNKLRVTKKDVPSQITEVRAQNCGISSTFDYRIRIKNGQHSWLAHVTVETKLVALLTPAETECLFRLFDQFFPWPGLGNEREKRTYFDEKLTPGKGGKDNLYIDIVRIGKTICGLNIAEMIEDEKVTLHDIRLAVTNLNVQRCRRLMSTISFLRGFARQLHSHPGKKVLTCYRANPTSLLQAKSMIFHPKYHCVTRDELRLIQKLALHNRRSEIREGVLYSTSPLSSTPEKTSTVTFFSEKPSETRSKTERFPDFAAITLEVDKTYFTEEGWSKSVIFENSPENLERLSGDINKCMSGITFSEVVRQFACTPPMRCML